MRAAISTGQSFGATVLVMMLGSGCVHYQDRPLSAGEGAKALESRSLTDETLKLFLTNNLQREWTSWPDMAWDVDMLMLAAFYYHPSLEVARRHWQVTQAEIKTAGGRPNPTVSVVPEYNFNAASGVSPWLPAINFDLPLETAGKRGHRMSRAEYLSEAARLGIATAAWLVRSNLRASLLDYTAAKKRQSLLSQQASAQERVTQLLEQRFAAGTIARADLTLPRIALAKSSLDLAEAERQMAEARARVAEAIGVPLRALEEAKLGIDWPTHVETSELSSTAARQQTLVGRADVLAALAEYAASQSALQLEIAKQYPDIHLGTGYQWDQGESKWQLGVTAEIPVLNRNQGPIAEAEARRGEAAARFEAVQAKVLAELERALEALRATEKNRAMFQSLAEEQSKQRQAVSQQVQAGAADQLDLANANIESGLGELARLDAETKWQQALGALEDAVQQPGVIPAKALRVEQRRMTKVE